MTLAIFCITPSNASSESKEAINFNSIFLRNENNKPVDISRFAHGNPVLPGEYQVEVKINNRWNNRANVMFIAQPGSPIALPCIDRKLIDQIGLDFDVLSEAARAEIVRIKSLGCADLTQIVNGASVQFDFSTLTLDIVIPQIALRRTPRGYISPEFWDEGVPSATLAYSLNSFRSVTPSRASTSSYLGLTSGANLGSWHLRQRSVFNTQADGTTSFQNIATYLLHDIPSLRSRLVIGDNFTDGTIFNSISYRGITIASDERMLPDSLRGYAPKVRGIARTNARVRISQSGNVLLETTVPPGNFEIDDLYPTGYGGDLQVTVYEADGSQQRFTVAYSSLIQLLRPGIWRYSATAAQVRDIQITSIEQFAQFGVQYGFNNLITGYAGAIASSNYRAGLIGIAFNTPVGAIALDLTQSKSDIASLSSATGQSMRLSYNKAIEQTGTNITLNAFRNLSVGYLSFRDSLVARQIATAGIDPNSLNQPLNLFQLNINQTLGPKRGSLYLTGSKTSYWNNSNASLQFQAGYSNYFTFSNVNLNYSIALNRVRDDATGRSANAILATLSFPLGTTNQSPQVSVQYSPNLPGTTAGQSLQTMLSGTMDENNTINYSGSISQQSNNNSISAAIQYLSPYSTLSTSASQGTNFSQQSLGANGGIVMHEGGITFANQLTDTFGIIQALGAQGARIPNSIGAKIDSRGYGIVPYLSPYRLNNISIDPEGIPLDVEFKNTSQQITPRADASVMVRFETRTGQAVIFKAIQGDGTSLPFGASIYDEDESEIGIVGQDGRIMMRTLDEAGRLKAKWGNSLDEQCSFNYQLPKKDKDQNLFLYLDVVCSTK
ncbi:fimbria/pilus outer membrane usher protein [Zwartia sp.]|uniref:fimbria/pilus outer membrane usher protein n=1 Tax=Zwartia sp. TaxID=2978004 RepID=UPI00271AD3AC|nr:fimbria/pilus outer membrane usher protein [Zwartia sp.]MDO9024715.1 fimbria/pilus outer membrane usher protein [Zwartia sp.]